MASLRPVALNNVYGTVQAGSTAIGSSTATGINVASGEGARFGTIGYNQYIPAVIVDTSTSPETVKEYVWITARSTDALTIKRQAEDSSRYPASTTTVAAGYVIAAVASRGSLLQVPSASLSELKAWNYDPLIANGGTAQQVTGSTLLLRLDWPGYGVLSNIHVIVSSAGTTLTSGQNFAGLYTSDGSSTLTKVAETGDQTTAWGSTGWKTMALTSTVTVDASILYVALLSNGTSPPLFARASFNAQANTGNLATATKRNEINSTVATSLPATFTTFSGGANIVWVGVS